MIKNPKNEIKKGDIYEKSYFDVQIIMNGYDINDSYFFIKDFHI